MLLPSSHSHVSSMVQAPSLVPPLHRPLSNCTLPSNAPPPQTPMLLPVFPSLALAFCLFTPAASQIPDPPRLLLLP